MMFKIESSVLDMTPCIVIENVWSDHDTMEFKITTSDGRSRFCVKVYAGRGAVDSLIAALDQFKSWVYGGIYDIEFGKFGPEYANGAFQARLHYHPNGNGQLFITVHAESDWVPFSKTDVASRATLYLKSEPGRLDQFISELRVLNSGTDDKAIFECV